MKLGLNLKTSDLARVKKLVMYLRYIFMYLCVYYDLTSSNTVRRHGTRVLSQYLYLFAPSPGAYVGAKLLPFPLPSFTVESPIFILSMP